jgi:hypothetical protein
VLTASTIRVIMEAVSTSETSVNYYQTTWHYNSEDSNLHTHCHENLKSYLATRLVLSDEFDSPINKKMHDISQHHIKQCKKYLKTNL